MFKAVQADGLYRVACTRCPDEQSWTGEMVCKRIEHDWVPYATNNYSKKKVNVLTGFESGPIDVSQRIWKCPRCDAIKEDAKEDFLDGCWYVVDGRFVHESEMRTHGFTITKVKSEE
jgi:hypothetical protein